MAGHSGCVILYLVVGIFLTASGQSMKRTYINFYYNIREINLPKASAICHEFDNDQYLPMLNTTAKILLYKTLKDFLAVENSASATRDYRFWTNATSDGTVFFWDNSPTCTALPSSSSLWASSGLSTSFSSNQRATYFEVSSTAYGLYRASSGDLGVQVLICEKEQEQCEYNGQSSGECPDPNIQYSTEVMYKIESEENCQTLCDTFLSGEAECWGFLYSDTDAECTLLYHINPLLLYAFTTNVHCPSSYPMDLKYTKKKCFFINFDSGEKSVDGNLRRTCTTALTYLTTSSTSTTTTTLTSTTSTTTSTTSSTSTTTPTTTSSTTSTTTPTTTSSTTSTTTPTTSSSTTSTTTPTTTSSTTSTTTPTTSTTTTTTPTSTSSTTTTTTATSSSTIITTQTTSSTSTTQTTTTTSTTLPSTVITLGGIPVAGSSVQTSDPLFIRSCFCSSGNNVNLTLEERTNQIIKELTIDASKTSATIRSKTSAKDNRSSSVSIGVVSIVFLIIPLILMFTLDVLRLCSTKENLT